MVTVGMEPWPWSLSAWRSLCHRRHGVIVMATIVVAIVAVSFSVSSLIKQA